MCKSVLIKDWLVFHEIWKKTKCEISLNRKKLNYSVLIL